jgi:Ca-activated chloride channel family protein
MIGRRTVLLLWTFVLVLFGCPDRQAAKPDEAGAAAIAISAAPEKAAPPLTLTIAYGSEKKTWLDEQIKAFLATSPKTASGRKISVDAKAMGSGEALQAITSGQLKAHVFSPASALYVTLLNDAWLSKAGNAKPLAKPGDPLVLSPVVIAMWKPMAEALGWPKKQLSWSDLLKVSANPKGWGAMGFAEWGKFKLGHCHPEFSNSGYLAVLAEAYAGAKKTRDLSAADLDAKPTRDLVSSVENTIVHYGKSTGFFADKMIERGPSYVSAAVLYENLVIEAYGKSPPLPIVAVYPVEGTFWSDHPYSILDAEWVGADEKAAAEQLLAFLKGKPAQERALALGFRPADPQIPVGAPIDASHGVDAKQPQTVLPVPDGKVLAKLLTLWKDTKKGADVVLVFDKSGSMRGAPLDGARTGAMSFLDSLGDRDEMTVMFFDNAVYPPFGPLPLKTGRPALRLRFDGVTAGGGTALYDAIAEAYDLAAKRATTDPSRTHAIVVMTDGADEGSKMKLEELKARFPKEETLVRVFTIAYGAQAETAVLAQIAEAAKGSSAKGSVESIRDVYLEMASFF